MQNSLLHKRIPTLLGIILLIGGFFAINFAVNNSVFFITQASPTYTPEEIRVTNLTDTSFTVSYTTQASVLGTLSYDASPTLSKVALDDRDQQTGTPQPYYIHHLTVRNLSPNTKYYYSILSANKTFLDNDKPFEIKTLSSLAQTPSRQTPIVGTVTNTNGSRDNNTIILLVTDGAQTLSTLTKADGSYVMPLNALRTKDYSSYITFNNNSVIKLLIQSPLGKATVSVLANQINPVPLITLNNSYDFTTNSSISSAPIASTSADTSSFPSFSATEAGPKEPSLINPDKGKGLNDPQPEFQGTALPNEEIQIEIHSSEAISATVNATKTGSWTYKPTTKLSPGQHTITIKTKNSKGILQTITQSFTVYAEGSQFTEPSISPSQPSNTPTPLSTITPISSPTPTVTPISTPTPTEVALPTPTVSTPTDILTQPPQPITEDPGSSITIISGILGTLAIGLGAMLLFIAKGSL